VSNVFELKTICLVKILSAHHGFSVFNAFISGSSSSIKYRFCKGGQWNTWKRL